MLNIFIKFFNQDLKLIDYFKSPISRTFIISSFILLVIYVLLFISFCYLLQALYFRIIEEIWSVYVFFNIIFILKLIIDILLLSNTNFDKEMNELKSERIYRIYKVYYAFEVLSILINFQFTAFLFWLFIKFLPKISHLDNPNVFFISKNLIHNNFLIGFEK